MGFYCLTWHIQRRRASQRGLLGDLLLFNAHWDHWRRLGVVASSANESQSDGQALCNADEMVTPPPRTLPSEAIVTCVRRTPITAISNQLDLLANIHLQS